MKLFSQRRGLKRVRTEIQIESMDDALRNGLWNVLWTHHWQRLSGWGGFPISDLSDMDTLFNRLWHDYFKRPLDTLPYTAATAYEETREYFFRCDWNEVFDFLEFVVGNHPDNQMRIPFMNDCNSVLEREVSAYRFVGERILETTSKEELAEIEEALGTAPKPVARHLGKSLDSLSDRKSPKYEDSIKESISAVEAICQLVTGNSKATLGQALKEIKDKVGLHPALKKAFSNLYGYTSSADGIRHALLEESNLDFEDAKFMLVSCSAFVNYLVAKSSKAGIEL